MYRFEHLGLWAAASRRFWMSRSWGQLAVSWALAVVAWLRSAIYAPSRCYLEALSDHDSVGVDVASLGDNANTPKQPYSGSSFSA